MFKKIALLCTALFACTTTQTITRKEKDFNKTSQRIKQTIENIKREQALLNIALGQKKLLKKEIISVFRALDRETVQFKTLHKKLEKLRYLKNKIRTTNYYNPAEKIYTSLFKKLTTREDTHHLLIKSIDNNQRLCDLYQEYKERPKKLFRSFFFGLGIVLSPIILIYGTIFTFRAFIIMFFSRPGTIGYICGDIFILGGSAAVLIGGGIALVTGFKALANSVHEYRDREEYYITTQ